jgi:hypothetical protein
MGRLRYKRNNGIEGVSRGGWEEGEGRADVQEGMQLHRNVPGPVLQGCMA